MSQDFYKILKKILCLTVDVESCFFSKKLPQNNNIDGNLQTLFRFNQVCYIDFLNGQ